MQLVHFITLFLILGFGIATFFYARGNATAQFATGVVTAVAYVCWGLLHHAAKKDLHANVVVEYVLIAAISIIVLFIVIRS
ncbi:hypothetical protein A3A64_03255 [Candidatus Gottesmanbacteria bacterium RIFCSPLOWO2_01_FULL_48_11]|nr:MAG: hypothetical protein A3A64_03255 [Candidatus Gottesmanbacteria bacterium RIFCSPLOWO2_01_FULL_48_11]